LKDGNTIGEHRQWTRLGGRIPTSGSQSAARTIGATRTIGAALTRRTAIFYNWYISKARLEPYSCSRHDIVLLWGDIFMQRGDIGDIV